MDSLNIKIPKSLRCSLEEHSRQEGISVNQFQIGIQLIFVHIVNLLFRAVKTVQETTSCTVFYM